jgi:glycosyltransferase involved in cell wall biosynthesis
MHVMQAIDSLHGGGAETSLLEMIPALADRGVQTSIVTLVDDDGALEDRVQALGVSRIRITQRGPQAMIALRNIVRNQAPDILHTTLWHSTLTGRLSVAANHTPVVTTLANCDYGPEHRANSSYGSWGVRALHAADMITARLTTRFHAISADVARTMSARLRIPDERLQVVYRGRDPARLGARTAARRARVRSELSIDPDTPVVLSVGRLDRQKGVETTVAAFGIVRSRLPDAVLLIAGRPGNASDAVASAALAVPGITMLGHRNDVPDLMCAADVLSFPSRWEGLGGTLIEAMALGLPIVASRIGPVAETIGTVGWPLVAPDDASALAAELMGILRGADIEVRRAAGRQRFSATFTVDAAADGMVDLYRRTVGDRLTPARADLPCP